MSFCFVALLGLIPASLSSTEATLRNTTTAGLAAAVVSGLRAAPGTAAVSIRYGLSIPAAGGAVLQALMSGAARDEIGSLPSDARSRTIQPALSPEEAAAVSGALISWPRSVAPGKDPLRRGGALVGKYLPGYTSGYGQPDDGLSADLSL
jgi:hypothetical protein